MSFDAASQPRIRMKGLLVVAAVVGVLVAAGVATGAIDFYFYWGDPDDPPPAVRDVAAIAEAADRTAADEAALAVRELVDLATARGGAAGAALVREHLPAVAATVESTFPTAIEQIRVLELTTAVGTACRQAALRVIARQQWLFRDFGARVGRTKATWKAIDRFTAEFESLGRSYEAELQDCLALASPEERPAIDQLMHAF
jgi:hypothetical protein